MRFLVQALLPVLFATTATAASVTGTVTTVASGGALQKMVVQAYDAAGMLRASASTDGTGFYTMTLDPGQYRFLAFDPAGVYATAFDANAESFETTPLRTISSSGAQISFRLAKGGVITGKIFNAFGFTLEGAVVEVYNLSGTRRGFASTNGSGTYSVVVPPGEYKLGAYELSGAYAVAFFRDVRSFAEATPLRVMEAESTSASITLGVAARVFGSTVDASTGLPLAAMLVYAYTPAGALVATTSTDAAGAFRLSLPAGDYRFVAADPSRVFATAYYESSRSFEGATVIALAPGEQRNGVRLALTRGARIVGRVNAPNLLVAAYNVDGTLHATTTSDAEGRYSLLVAPGEVRIAVSDPSLTYATLFYGGTTDFRFAQTLVVNADIGGIDVTLPRGGRVSGTARDAVNAQGLAGMTVVAYDVTGRVAATAITAADGRYALVVVPGTYRLLAFDTRLTYATAYAGGAMSYETAAPIAVEADAMLTADFALRRGVRVDGMVTNAGGDPLTDIEVFALDASGNRAAGATSKNGAFAIVVPPGNYRFIAVDPFRRYASSEPTAEMIIVDGQTPPAITLTLSTLARRRSVRH